MPTTITAVAPNRGPLEGGTTVVITGTEFRDGARVFFGGVPGTVEEIAGGVRIRAKTPRGAGVAAVDVRVTNADATTATSANAFTYLAQLKTITPKEGSTHGDPITLEGVGLATAGLGFEAHPGGAGVGVALVGVAVVSDTRVTARMPPHVVGRVEVRVTLAGVAHAALIYGHVLMISGGSPNTVRCVGNESVVLRGRGFFPGAAVRFGATDALGVVVDSPTQITAVTPPHAAGLVDIVVENDPGTAMAATGTLLHAITYATATVTGLVPSRGPVSGGTRVIIRGHCFAAGAAVTIGANVVVPASITTSAIAVTMPPHPAGPVDVIVQNAAGGEPAATLVGGFTYVATPTVTGVKPARGVPGGGMPMTITGTDFQPGARVRIGGVEATGVTVVSPTTITATSPAHQEGPRAVQVANPAGATGSLANAFTYGAIQSIQPNRGDIAGNTRVVIRGEGFRDERVRIGGVDGTNTHRLSGIAIRSTTPPHAAGAVDVALQGWLFSTTLPAGFTYSRVVRAQPDWGPVAGGTAVVIHGSGFDGATTVDFGGVAAPVVAVAAAQIQVQSPAVAVPGPVDLVVHFGGAIGDVTFPAAFSYVGAPTVTGIDPPAGTAAGGTTVTITGTDFVASSTVTIGGVAATNVRVVSATTITATTPAHPVAPGVAVAVTDVHGQTHALAAAYVYRAPPAVTAVAGVQGPIGGGRSVTISGTDFIAGATAFFGAAEASGVVWVSGTTLTATIPENPVGAVDVSVRNRGDAASGPVLAGGFNYVDAPTELGHNDIDLLVDGEDYFERLRTEFERIRALPRNDLTYIRMAFWMVTSDVTLGDRQFFASPNHLLTNYIDQAIRSGHDVDIILWRPARRERFSEGAGVAEANEGFARVVWDIDVAAAEEGPHVGRARVFLEQYEGELGASLHQKIAIFSDRGQRVAIIGGINLSPSYFDAFANHPRGWHDAAVQITGPATDDIEAEWMRRWRRTRVVTDRWIWNTAGGGGTIYARNFALTEQNTVRVEAISIVDNCTPQQHFAANLPICVATTRSEGERRYPWIRDRLLGLIGQAQHRIYMENYLFTDPLIVSALIARHEALRLLGQVLQIAIVTNVQGGVIGFMGRRSWLQMLLNMRVGPGPGVPTCTRFHYQPADGGPILQVDTALHHPLQVTNTYRDAAPVEAGFFERDSVTFRLLAGAAPAITIPLSSITQADGDFHFYTPRRLPARRAPMMVHSKIAIIDDVIVIGSANWSYRSMQYDGEISAFIRHQGRADAFLHRLLAHYNTAPALPVVTMNNIEARAQANAGALPPAGTVLVPLCFPNSWNLPRTFENNWTNWATNHTWY